MNLIAHRGNINGPDPSKENHPHYIEQAIGQGFDVEVDVRYSPLDDKLYLGHDTCQYPVTWFWFGAYKNNLWIHCKNIEALYEFSSGTSGFNYFWHQNDDYAFTSKGYFWVYPGRYLFYHKSICVCPEIACGGDWIKCYGVCSDFIETYGK